eukprot:9039674-Alexandrium_andersonii.AAC.1
MATRARPSPPLFMQVQFWATRSCATTTTSSATSCRTSPPTLMARAIAWWRQSGMWASRSCPRMVQKARRRSWQVPIHAPLRDPSVGSSGDRAVRERAAPAMGAGLGAAW